MAAPAIKRGGRPKGLPKTGGRQKGVPNRSTSEIKMLLRDAILEAGERSGGQDGLVGYLTTLAMTNSSAYASLLGKVLPYQVEGTADDGAISIRWMPPA